MKAFLGIVAGALFVPAVSILALLGTAGSELACSALTPDAALSASAPVPAVARQWVALAHAACPTLPTPWIAAVMMQESGFQSDAHASDANGGTWGLFQLNADVWQAAYGAPWNADLDHDGVWDVKEPTIHASTAGAYFCRRLDGVRALRIAHPDWAATRDLTELDDLVIAHNAGEGRLATYPAIPSITEAFLRNVRSRAAAWALPTTPLASDSPSSASPSDSASPARSELPTALDACGVAAIGPGGRMASVPSGSPNDVTAAIQTALALARARSGWLHLCDRLVCRAYGYANSGYPSATVHWRAMLATGYAHSGDRCPPTGAFLFWTTSGPLGHAALVVRGDAGCDPRRVLVLSNMVLDRETGSSGGAYIVTLARIESGFVTPAGYQGWSDPVCAGTPAPPADLASQAGLR